MRWNMYTLQQRLIRKAAKLSQWHTWFAWYPVQVDTIEGTQVDSDGRIRFPSIYDSSPLPASDKPAKWVFLETVARCVDCRLSSDGKKLRKYTTIYRTLEEDFADREGRKVLVNKDKT